MNEENNKDIRKYFISDEHVLKAKAVLGKAPIYLGALAKDIIRERIIAMRNEGICPKVVKKKLGVSLSHVYKVYRRWLRLRRKK